MKYNTIYAYRHGHGRGYTDSCNSGCGCTANPNWQCTWQTARWRVGYYTGTDYSSGLMVGGTTWVDSGGTGQIDSTCLRGQIGFMLPTSYDWSNLANARLDLYWTSASTGAGSLKIVKKKVYDVWNMALSTYADYNDGPSMIFGETPVHTPTGAFSHTIPLNGNAIADLKTCIGSRWQIGLRSMSDYYNNYILDNGMNWISGTGMVYPFMPSLLLGFWTPGDSNYLPQGYEVPALDTIPSYVRIGTRTNRRTRRGLVGI